MDAEMRKMTLVYKYRLHFANEYSSYSKVEELWLLVKERIFKNAETRSKLIRREEREKRKEEEVKLNVRFWNYTSQRAATLFREYRTLLPSD